MLSSNNGRRSTEKTTRLPVNWHKQDPNGGVTRQCWSGRCCSLEWQWKPLHYFRLSESHSCQVRDNKYDVSRKKKDSLTLTTDALKCSRPLPHTHWRITGQYCRPRLKSSPPTHSWYVTVHLGAQTVGEYTAPSLSAHHAHPPLPSFIIPPPLSFSRSLKPSILSSHECF